MQRVTATKLLLVAVIANACFAALAWAVATARIASPHGVDVVALVVSIPGLLLAVMIWGLQHNRTALSDAVIIATNTFVYTMTEILVIRVCGAITGRLSKQRTSA